MPIFVQRQLLPTHYLHMVIKFTEENIQEVAEQLAEIAKTKKLISFEGEMAAGKTTLIAAICKSLGFTGNVSSPTFSLINQYPLPDANSIFHIDLYRLSSTQEAIQAGIEECFYSGDICLIEWPSITPEIIPSEAVHCQLIKLNQNTRELTISM
jgi:tRNA threonylcarbamoyladenosine biosynthesis protein TsaE